MNLLQAVIFCVMLADIAKFIYDVERARFVSDNIQIADGLTPINRGLIEMAKRQL